MHPSTDQLGRCLGDALEHLVPVKFKNCRDLAECRPGDAVLSLSGHDNVLRELVKRRLRHFHVMGRPVGLRSDDEGEPVRFADSLYLNELLRGRTIPHQVLFNLEPVPMESGDEVLAHYGDRPVWVLRRTDGLAAQIVAARLPELGQAKQLFDYLNGYHYIQLLPLLHFLREIAADIDWIRPPVRACFTFDDPNLHWPAYGFLSYRELFRQARKDRFHISLATIPLDVWGPHSGAVTLIKENGEHVSLLIHGNNHTRNEFGHAGTRQRYLSMLAQSLRRIEWLEKVTGLHVDRVMVPPHEALAAAVLAPLLALGFEGASLSMWSLRHWNPGREWPCTFGLEVAESTDGGFPILGRYRLNGACEGPVVISALLGRPVILAEHHGAAASGLELLSGAARVINSLASVKWCSIEMMLRSNYLHRREHATLWIRPYSRRIHLIVPEGVNQLVLALAQHQRDEEATEFSLIRRRPGTETIAAHIQPGVAIEVCPGETIELVSMNLGAVDHHHLETASSPVWAIYRRVLCEARDRVEVMKPWPRRI